jgi:flagellar biosynthesis/type III secretory pathway protein FliH
MKSKEEIEQLAKKSNAERGIDSAKSMLEREYVLGYTNAYTQCQEDMAEEIVQLKKSIQKAVDLMCEADEEIANLKEQLLGFQNP